VLHEGFVQGDLRHHDRTLLQFKPVVLVVSVVCVHAVAASAFTQWASRMVVNVFVVLQVLASLGFKQLVHGLYGDIKALCAEA